MNFGKTFFPNTRKEITVENISLQRDKSDVLKIKIAVSMSLDDGKQVGMPSWVGDHYDRLAQAECMAGSVKYPEMALEEMTVYCHTGDETKKPAQTFICPTINGFSMVRGDAPKREGGLPPVWLEFSVYINASLEAWGWLFRHFRPNTFYMLFLNTQQDLNEPISADPQMKLVPEKDSDDDVTFEKQVASRVHRAVAQ